MFLIQHNLTNILARQKMGDANAFVFTCADFYTEIDETVVLRIASSSDFLAKHTGKWEDGSNQSI